MTAFEDFVNLELPRRSAHLTYEITGYDGDPNDGSAPAILQGSPKGTWFLQATGGIWWRKKTSSADSWIVSNKDATYDVLHIYVRAVDGDDSNDGLTTSTPLATLIEAEKRIPLEVNHTVIIHVGPHTGDGYEICHFRPRNFKANVWMIGDGGGGITDGFNEIVSPTSALSGSTNLLIKTSGLSTSEFQGNGQYHGYTIEILTGAAAGDRRTIRNNTATDIYPLYPFSATIAENDTYRILLPETNIYPEYDVNNKVFVEKCGYSSALNLSGINYYNLKIVNFNIYAPGGIVYLIINDSSVEFYGIYGLETLLFDLVNSVINFGVERHSSSSTSVPSSVSDLGVVSNTSWSGWSIGSQQADGRMIIYGSGFLHGYITGKSIELSDYTFMFLLGGLLWGPSFGLGVFSRSKCYIYANNQPTIIGSLIGTDKGIRCSDGYIYAVSFNSNMLQIRSSNIGIECQDNGIIDLYPLTSNAMQIECGGIGMVVKDHGMIRTLASYPINTNCAGGDFSIDEGDTTYPISELTSGAKFTEITNGSIIGG